MHRNNAICFRVAKEIERAERDLMRTRTQAEVFDLLDRTDAQ